MTVEKINRQSLRSRQSTNKVFLVVGLLLSSLVLGACGDSTATPVALATTAASTAAPLKATTAAAAPKDNAEVSNLIRIYSSMPLAGGSKEAVQTSVNAFTMALDEFTGGTSKIGNFTIEYTSLSSGSESAGQFDPELEKANATRAISDPNTMLMVGPSNSGAAKISLPLLNQAGIAMISPDNTYPGLTRSASGSTRMGEPEMYYPAKTRTYFRVSTPDDVQSPATLEFLKTLKAKKVFIIDDSEVYGKGLADLVVASCKKEGLDCSKRTSITNKESSYEPLVAGIKATNPDAIFYGGGWQPSTLKLLMDIRAAGLKIPIIGGDGLNVVAAAKDSGPAGENVYAINSGTPEEKLPAKGQETLKRYQAKYGKYEYPRTLLAYESMYVGLSAIKSAGVKDRKAITQALTSIKDYDGVLGKWSFDQNGDISLTEFTILHIVDGKWKYFTSVNPKLTS